MIAPVVRVRNRDGDKHSAITFSSAYENAARVAGIAGLNADAAVIAPKQLVMIRESPARTGYGFGRDGQAELCVLQCSLCKMSKIKCGGVIFHRCPIHAGWQNASVSDQARGRADSSAGQTPPRLRIQRSPASKPHHCRNGASCRKAGPCVSASRHFSDTYWSLPVRRLRPARSRFSNSSASQTRRPVMIFVVLAISAR